MEIPQLALALETSANGATSFHPPFIPLNKRSQHQQHLLQFSKDFSLAIPLAADYFDPRMEQVLFDVRRIIILSKQQQNQSKKKTSSTSSPTKFFLTSGSLLRKVSEAFALLRSGFSDMSFKSALSDCCSNYKLNQLTDLHFHHQSSKSAEKLKFILQTTKNQSVEWLQQIEHQQQQLQQLLTMLRSGTTTDKNNNATTTSLRNFVSSESNIELAIKRLELQKAKAISINKSTSQDNNNTLKKDLIRISNFLDNFLKLVCSEDCVENGNHLDPNLVAEWLRDPPTIDALLAASFSDLCSMTSISTQIPVACLTVSKNNQNNQFSSARKDKNNNNQKRPQLNVFDIPVILASGLEIEKLEISSPLFSSGDDENSNNDQQQNRSLSRSRSNINRRSVSYQRDDNNDNFSRNLDKENEDKENFLTPTQIDSKQLAEIKFKLRTIFYRSLVCAGMMQHSSSKQTRVFVMSSIFQFPTSTHPSGILLDFENFQKFQFNNKNNSNKNIKNNNNNNFNVSSSSFISASQQLERVEIESLIDVLRDTETKITQQQQEMKNINRNKSIEVVRSIILHSNSLSQYQTWKQVVHEVFVGVDSKNQQNQQPKPLSLFSITILPPSVDPISNLLRYSLASKLHDDAVEDDSGNNNQEDHHSHHHSHSHDHEQSQNQSSTSHQLNEKVEAPFVVIAAAPPAAIMLSDYRASPSSLLQALDTDFFQEAEETRMNANKNKNKNKNNSSSSWENKDYSLLRRILDFSVPTEDVNSNNVNCSDLTPILPRQVQCVNVF